MLFLGAHKLFYIQSSMGAHDQPAKFEQDDL